MGIFSDKRLTGGESGRSSAGVPANQGEKGSRPISRVLSWAIIPLGSASPRTSSSLPGNDAGHACCSPIWPCSGWGLPCRFRCRSRGALLPHRFTLTCAPHGGPSAVCSLLHWPSARAAQALPGTLPNGARTFLHTHACSDCLADSRAHGTEITTSPTSARPDQHSALPTCPRQFAHGSRAITEWLPHPWRYRAGSPSRKSAVLRRGGSLLRRLLGRLQCQRLLVERIARLAGELGGHACGLFGGHQWQ